MEEPRPVTLDEARQFKPERLRKHIERRKKAIEEFEKAIDVARREIQREETMILLMEAHAQADG